jgi:hypothetical protein
MTDYNQLKFMAVRPPAGTESLYNLLRAIVSFVRPTSVLEIGAGLTTVAITEALEHAVAHDVSNNLYIRPSYNTDYKPTLISIDSEFPQELIVQLRLTELVTPIRDNFKSCSFNKDQFDFAFFDCGGWEEYKFFIEHYWDYLQVGSTIIFHYTWIIDRDTDTLKESMLLPMLRKNKSAEFTSLVEPHKYAQGSISIVRKISNDPIILEE